MSIGKLGLNQRDTQLVFGLIKKLERTNAPKNWTGYYGVWSPGDHVFLKNIQEETPLDALLKLVEKSGYYNPFTRAKVKHIKTDHVDYFGSRLKTKEVDIEKHNAECYRLRQERHERLYGKKKSPAATGFK